MFFPFISALLAGFAGRFIGAAFASVLSTLLIVFTFFLSCYSFVSVGLLGDSVTFSLSSWISVGLLDINWGFLFDPLSTSVICVVTGVSSLVHIYSIG